MTSPQISSLTASIKQDKKKLKVLKMALKEERATRATIELDLKGAHEKVELMKFQLSEKVLYSYYPHFLIGLKIPVIVQGKHQPLRGSYQRIQVQQY